MVTHAHRVQTLKGSKKGSAIQRTVSKNGKSRKNRIRVFGIEADGKKTVGASSAKVSAHFMQKCAKIGEVSKMA